MNKIFAALVSLFMILGTAAPIVAQDPTSSATVNNVAPVVTNKLENPNPVNLNPNGNVDVIITATISDGNGLDDIISVAFTSGIGNGEMTLNTETGIATGTLNLLYNTLPSTYTVTVTATDAASATGTESNPLTVNELKALSLDFTAVNFGSLNPGERTPALTSPSGNINNAGNVVIDVNEKATWNAPAAGFITENQVGLVGPYVIDGASGADYNVDILVGGSTTASFWLTVPIGTNPGSYTGTIAISAI